MLLTVVETEYFAKLWREFWSEDERGEFAAYLAANPEAGDVIQGSGGCRKVRWSRAGTGKSSGVRVIYFAHNAAGELVLLSIYAKAKFDNIPAHILKALKKEIEHD
jgi:hypothetical protein